jgi:histidinol-phosphate phosphatase family protein
MAVTAKSVFLDKDGTLIEDDPWDRTPEHIRLMPGTVEGLRLLHQAGYALVVITNQAGVAQGRFTFDAIAHEEMALRMRLARFGIALSGFYVCPHHPDGTIAAYRTQCLCRKPKPGLLMQAACELHLDLSRSWMVGDILHDVEAGRSAGCGTVLLTNGHETEWDMSPMRWPDLLADNLLETAHLILAADGSATKDRHRLFEREED